MTVRLLLLKLSPVIGGHSSALDAALITAHVLKTTRERLYLDPDRELSADEIDAAWQLATRRQSGEPIAYLLGYKEFYGRRFVVDSRVLVPRPDSEIMIEAVLRKLQGNTARWFSHAGANRPLRILDLCCGSGCLGITLAAEIPDCEIVLADIDPAALAVAEKNAFLLLPPDRQPTCICSDLFAAIEGRFDVIISNPPYVTETEYRELRMDRWQEPRHALTAADDGLEIIRRIADTVVDYIYPHGYVAIEASDRQAPAICDLLVNKSFTEVSHVLDLAGKRRVTGGVYLGQTADKAVTDGA